MPVMVWPRTGKEIGEPQRRMLQRGLPLVQHVDEAELARATCHELVKHGSRGNGWMLSKSGRECFELLTYTP
jgi:hypothetical protein